MINREAFVNLFGTMMIQRACGKCWLISMEGKCLCSKNYFLRFQCLILVSRFACDVLKDPARDDTYNSLKYDMFLVYYFFITLDFLILVPDLRNFILDTRIYMSHSSVQCSVLYFWNQSRKLQTILETFSEFCILNQRTTDLFVVGKT